MKKKITFLLVSFLLTLGLNAQSTMDIKYPEVIGGFNFADELFDVHFVSESIGYVSSTAGAIFKTSNGGLTWDSLSTESSVNIESIYFWNSNYGWAAGGNEIINTKDGGLSWSRMIVVDDFFFTSIMFTDSLNGWVVGSKNTIFNTNNGGENWTRIYSPIGSNSTIHNKVHFINSQVGWICGSGYLLKTSNGGLNWSWESSSYNITDIFFTNENEGWLCTNNGLIRKTTNGGQTWTTNLDLNIQSIDFPLKKIFFIDDNTGWVVGGKSGIYGGESKILYTQNAGLNWDLVKIEGSILRTVFFISPTTGWAVGKRQGFLSINDGGALFNTKTGENNWANQTKFGATLNSTYFIDSLVGWAVSNRGNILKTDDGGNIWHYQSALTNESLNSVFFIDKDNGWAVGENGSVISSQNGGIQWQKRDNLWHSQDNESLNNVFFINQNIGWIVGDPSFSRPAVILKTIDGGQTWSIQPSNVWNRINSVFFIDENNGWAVGGTYQKGIILKTTNGGLTWSQTVLTDIHNLNSVYFINNQKGFAVGYGGVLMETNNGGEAWQKKNIGGYGSENITKVIFNNPLDGWALSSSIVYTTKDGGLNWDAFIFNAFQSIGFVDIHPTKYNKAIVVGSFEHSIVEVKLNYQPNLSDFQMVAPANKTMTLFPNPVKFRLKLEITNETNNVWNITIFDLNGKAVKRYYDFNIENEINTEDLTSGVYLIQLSSDNQKFNQKFIIE